MTPQLYAALALAGVNAIVVGVTAKRVGRDTLSEMTTLDVYGFQGEKIALGDNLELMVEDAALDIADDMVGAWRKAEVTISIPDGTASAERV